jgi:hypothetical protein
MILKITRKQVKTSAYAKSCLAALSQVLKMWTPAGATGSCQPRRERHDRHDRHRHIQGKSPGKSFDEEMANYESQIAKIALNNIMRPPPGRSLSRPKETFLLQDQGPHTKLAGSADLSELANSHVVSISPVDSSLPSQNLPNCGDAKVCKFISHHSHFLS